jgi:hypothetical protein
MFMVGNTNAQGFFVVGLVMKIWQRHETLLNFNEINNNHFEPTEKVSRFIGDT